MHICICICLYVMCVFSYMLCVYTYLYLRCRATCLTPGRNKSCPQLWNIAVVFLFPIYWILFDYLLYKVFTIFQFNFFTVWYISYQVFATCQFTFCRFDMLYQVFAIFAKQNISSHHIAIQRALTSQYCNTNLVTKLQYKCGKNVAMRMWSQFCN